MQPAEMNYLLSLDSYDPALSVHALIKINGQAVLYERASIISGDEVCAEMTVENAGETPKSIYLAAAVYDFQGTLLEISNVSVSIGAMDEETLSACAIVPEAGRQVKFFLWDGPMKINVIAPALSLERGFKITSLSEGLTFSANCFVNGSEARGDYIVLKPNDSFSASVLIQNTNKSLNMVNLKADLYDLNGTLLSTVSTSGTVEASGNEVLSVTQTMGTEGGYIRLFIENQGVALSESRLLGLGTRLNSLSTHLEVFLKTANEVENGASFLYEDDFSSNLTVINSGPSQPLYFAAALYQINSNGIADELQALASVIGTAPAAGNMCSITNIPLNLYIPPCSVQSGTPDSILKIFLFDSPLTMLPLAESFKIGGMENFDYHINVTTTLGELYWLPIYNTSSSTSFRVNFDAEYFEIDNSYTAPAGVQIVTISADLIEFNYSGNQNLITTIPLRSKKNGSTQIGIVKLN